MFNGCVIVVCKQKTAYELRISDWSSDFCSSDRTGAFARSVTKFGGMRPVAIGTATIRDVARAAQVSVASASRALNGHHSVTPATRERVLSAAQALNYVPHIGPRPLSTRRPTTTGVAIGKAS